MKSGDAIKTALLKRLTLVLVYEGKAFMFILYYTEGFNSSFKKKLVKSRRSKAKVESSPCSFITLAKRADEKAEFASCCVLYLLINSVIKTFLGRPY